MATDWKTEWKPLALIVGLFLACFYLPLEDTGLWHALWLLKWPLTAACAAVLGAVLVCWFGMAWWKMLAVAVPAAVLAGVFPAHPMIPFVFGVVGLSLLTSTNRGELGEWFASTWAFARQITPLLLAGPALSLQSMLVLRTLMGTQKTAVYVALVIVMATISGLIYGVMAG